MRPDRTLAGSSQGPAHPGETEWMDFLYGELTTQRKRELQEHLRQCDSCARQVHEWRKAVTALKSYKTSLPAVQRRPRFQPILRWASAAAVILVIGFALGRATSASTRQIRELQVSVSRLQQEASVPRDRNEAVLVRAAAEVANRQTLRLLNDYTLALSQQNAQERQTTALALRSLEQQCLSLRTGLETLANDTQRGLQATHQDLALLAAYSTTPLPEESTTN